MFGRPAHALDRSQLVPHAQHTGQTPFVPGTDMGVLTLSLKHPTDNLEGKEVWRIEGERMEVSSLRPYKDRLAPQAGEGRDTSSEQAHA